MDYIVGLYEEDDLQRDYHGGGGSFQMCEKFKRRTEWFLIELVKYKYRKPFSFKVVLIDDGNQYICLYVHRYSGYDYKSIL
jgi:hypothetical protein